MIKKVQDLKGPGGSARKSLPGWQTAGDQPTSFYMF